MEELTTYAGLAAISMTLVEGIKRLWKQWIDGKEPVVSLGLVLILGVVAKLTIHGAFASVSWLTHIVGLVLTALGAGVAHDKVMNPLLRDDKKA